MCLKKQPDLLYLFLRIDGDKNLDNDLLTELLPIQSVKFEIESNYRKILNFLVEMLFVKI